MDEKLPSHESAELSPYTLKLERDEHFASDTDSRKNEGDHDGAQGESLAEPTQTQDTLNSDNFPSQAEHSPTQEGLGTEPSQQAASAEHLAQRSREERGPAIVRARLNAEVRELSDKYWALSRAHKIMISELCTAFRETPDKKRVLKVHKISLCERLNELNVANSRLCQVAESDVAIEEDLSDMHMQTETLKEQYRSLFPKLDPYASSSDLTSTVASGGAREVSLDASLAVSAARFRSQQMVADERARQEETLLLLEEKASRTMALAAEKKAEMERELERREMERECARLEREAQDERLALKKKEKEVKAALERVEREGKMQEEHEVFKIIKTDIEDQQRARERFMPQLPRDSPIDSRQPTPSSLGNISLRQPSLDSRHFSSPRRSGLMPLRISSRPPRISATLFEASPGPVPNLSQLFTHFQQQSQPRLLPLRR
ncbi:myosin heavy chain, cardiac muscle isoform-like [Littorina saxatilis]|uniref:myosin heavy chain, cardiac muscle isoform-like n=1 Tax=Littorina saxatilis TaxID=31220 RepID=UPI0038B5F1F2